jgi:CubicO group peptidase (beta-lactamase class C family)
MTRLEPRGGWRAAASCFVLALVARAHGAASPPAAAEPRFEPLRQAMQRAVSEQRLPSVAVAVSQGGKVVFEEATGWADVERRVPAATDVPYALGEVTQAVTATAVMTLVDRGKLALDRPASEYLRSQARLTVYEGQAADVTLRRLLSHTAGLPPHRQFFYSDAGELPPATTTTIQRYGIVVAPPGDFLQSNVGYAILGSLAGRAARREFAELVASSVLAPLDLGRSALAGVRGVAGAAIAYDDERRPLPPFGTDHAAAAGIQASVHDLVRFGMFHLRDHLPEQQAVLKDETILDMQKPVAPLGEDEPGASVGLGWILRDDRGIRRVEQDAGPFPGATARLTLVPQHDVAVAVLANGHSPAAAAEIVDQALGLVLPAFPPRPAPASAPPSARFAPEPAWEGSWEGELQTWEGPLPFKLTVQPGGAVRVKLGTQPEADVRDLRRHGARMTGRIDGVTIPTADAHRRPHVVELTLWPSGPRLVGWATAVLGGPRPSGALTSRLELSRPRPSPTTPGPGAPGIP